MSVIYLGADHAGFEYKEHVRTLLEKSGLPYVDLGTYKKTPKVDYPPIAKQVAESVKRHKGAGILICGTGTGMCIAANKVKGIRAGVGYDVYSTEMARKDNDINVLCLRGRKFPKTKLKPIVTAFLETLPSKAERHKKRVRQLNRM